MAYAQPHHGHHGSKHQHMAFPMGASSDDFMMGGTVATCDAQVQLGFLRKVRLAQRQRTCALAPL